MDFGSPVRAIATDPFEDGILYVGTTRRGIYRSVDDGGTWQATLPATAVHVIAADPVRPGHLYAATDRGVFRSTDRAATWLPEGLPPALSVTSLVFARDGRRLHAGSDGGGIYRRDLEGTSECAPSESRLCLAGGRYAVDLFAGRRGEPTTTPGTARPLADRGGYFSLPFATGDATLPEVVVKILGHGALGTDGTPIFHTSLTTLPYALTVTDTFTGRQETYRSDDAQPLCGGVDIAFEPDEATRSPDPSAAKSAASDLRLLNGRFSLTLEARHPRTGAATSGTAIASADRFGFFTLPGFTSDPTLPEVIVKMLDFRSINGTFIVFYTGLTSADYTLTVTDTVSGATRTYDSAGDYCGSVVSETFGEVSTPRPPNIRGLWSGTYMEDGRSRQIELRISRDDQDNRVRGGVVDGHVRWDYLAGTYGETRFSLSIVYNEQSIGHLSGTFSETRLVGRGVIDTPGPIEVSIDLTRSP
jgi:hypothetical protein